MKLKTQNCTTCGKQILFAYDPFPTYLDPEPIPPEAGPWLAQSRWLARVIVTFKGIETRWHYKPGSLNIRPLKGEHLLQRHQCRQPVLSWQASLLKPQENQTDPYEGDPPY